MDNKTFNDEETNYTSKDIEQVLVKDEKYAELVRLFRDILKPSTIKYFATYGQPD